MDYEWIEAELRSFVFDMERYQRSNAPLESDGQPPNEAELLERSAAMEVLVRSVMPAAPWILHQRGRTFTFDAIHETCLKALGLVRNRDEIARRLSPASPQLSADMLHPWVWESAGSLWETGHFRAAIQAAATSVDVRLQTKLNRRDPTGTQLAREAFRAEAAVPGRARLRVHGDPSSSDWRTRQAGARDFAAGCFEALRNPSSHTLTEPSEQEALEQLAALSLLSRWIDASEIEGAS